MSTEIDWSSFRYSDPVHSREPEPICKAMLDAGVVHSDLWDGYWIVSSYDQVLHAYQTPEVYTSYPNHIPAAASTEEGSGLGSVGRLIPNEIDLPDHTGYRRILAEPFSPATVRQYEPFVRERTAELLAPILENGGGEFISAFTTPLPSEIWCKLMGVPASDAVAAVEWAYTIFHGDPDSPDGGMEIRAKAGFEIYAYLNGLVEERKKNPGDDLLSYLMSAKFNGERELRLDEILNTSFFILGAGLDTTKGQLGFALHYLATHPEQRRKLVENPEIMPTAVEELLRIHAPVTPGRTLSEDSEIGGVTVKKGEHVLLMPPAANFDPVAFPDPDTVDLCRNPNRHLAFGAGIHRCTGSHLARLTMRAALEVLHELMPDYRLDPDKDTVFEPYPVRGVKELHLLVGSG
ncbi:MAG TPA: cytochrome P450 [Pseudonocardia sp.]|nr:cytochrome P450 [Pseudonocardia sp.]